MLQAIRSKATSFLVKILFGLLIVTFGIWGIGDIFQDRGPSTTVATVGSVDISAQQVSQELQSEINLLQKQMGSTIDLAEAKQLGLVNQALQHLIGSNLIDLEINRLGLAISDDTVRGAILNTKAFQDPSGRFDPNIYAQVLAANNMTEPQFETDMRADILRTQLVDALTSGMSAPKSLVDTLYRSRNEHRVADFVLLPVSAAPAVPAPTEAEIAAYYKAHAALFRTPERRNVTVARLLLSDVAAGIKVSDAALHKAYNDRANDFDVPEQRHLDQLLFSDEASAKKAAAEIAAGKDFAAVAKGLAKADPSETDLGWVKQDDLPAELGTAAFALKPGGTTAPIKSTFGWHILHLEGVKPPSTKTFDQVKDQLKNAVARDRASDRIADIANHIDDALAGGDSFSSIVQKFSLKTTALTDIDRDGNGPDGKPATVPEPRAAILHAAFSTDSGQISPLTDEGDGNNYFIVRVEKVTPASTKPLAAVHDQAAKLWQEDARHAELDKLAQAMAKEVDAGKSLKAVAAEHKLSVLTTHPLSRTGGDARIPPTIIAKLFETKKGTAVTDASTANVVVAQLTAVEPADPVKEAAAAQDMGQALSSDMRRDILDEFDQGLRHNFTVTVDQAALDRLL